MVLEQRIQDMEEEVNLLKAEVKVTLVDIREHLLNTDVNAVLSGAKVSAGAQSRSIDNDGKHQEMEWIERYQSSAPRSTLTEEGVANVRRDDGYFKGEASAQLRSDEKLNNQYTLDTVDPNLMASLLRWVVLTRKHIGYEELDDFMEICSLSGGLPDVIRQLVCRITEIVRDDASIDENYYSKWSDLMLQLHGIIGLARFSNQSKQNLSAV